MRSFFFFFFFFYYYYFFLVQVMIWDEEVREQFVLHKASVDVFFCCFMEKVEVIEAMEVPDLNPDSSVSVTEVSVVDLPHSPPHCV
jgi:hypothetical protein